VSTAPELGATQATVRVRYAETDKMGVVYHANYFVWFEVGRANWLRQSGWTYREMEGAGVSLPVIEAHCEYSHPARYDDEVAVEARPTLLSPVRVRFDYAIARVEDGTTLATGHTVHAAVDPSGRPCRLPGRLLTLLRGAGSAPGDTGTSASPYNSDS
jgi:acyl-CoA thioester hydrolase